MTALPYIEKPISENGPLRCSGQKKGGKVDVGDLKYVIKGNTTATSSLY